MPETFGLSFLQILILFLSKFVRDSSEFKKRSPLYLLSEVSNENRFVLFHRFGDSEYRHRGMRVSILNSVKVPIIEGGN